MTSGYSSHQYIPRVGRNRRIPHTGRATRTATRTDTAREMRTTSTVRLLAGKTYVYEGRTDKERYACEYGPRT
jgi:hypothetical protein